MCQPEKTFRIGSCSASVFLNTANGAQPYRSVSLQRRYRDGEEWKTSSSYSLAHLPAAIAVMQMAQDYVASKEASGSE